MGNSDGEAKLILEQILRLFHGAASIEKDRLFLDKKKLITKSFKNPPHSQISAWTNLVFEFYCVSQEPV